MTNGKNYTQRHFDSLRLIRTPSIGPIAYRALLDKYGSATEALRALPHLKRAVGKPPVLPIDPDAVMQEISLIEQTGVRLVGHWEADYPPLLTQIADAPPLLITRGNLTLIDRPTLAIVGARNASAMGKRFAREIAWDLAQAGLVIVSGLARGIDTAAHGGALQTGTVAVVGGGVDVIYPEENRALQEEIAQNGLLVSEMPLGTVPQARHFPRRNRIISGLSLGTLVIEAALKSGSLITARFAADQGRDVFAVPGSPLDPRCRGPNDLLRNGATLVENADDVLTTLNLLESQFPRLSRAFSRQNTPKPLVQTQAVDPDDVKAILLSLLSQSQVTVDELIRECHFSGSVVASALVDLELDGRIDRHPGNRVSLR